MATLKSLMRALIEANPETWRAKWHGARGLSCGVPNGGQLPSAVTAEFEGKIEVVT